MKRLNWNIDKSSPLINLSNNVCYDSVLFNQVKGKLSNIDYKDILSYNNEYEIYSIISRYYNFDISNLAIGYGSTELIDRIVRLLRDYRFTILSPTFEMVSVYCKMYGTTFNEISYSNFNQISIKHLTGHEVLYIANPNGNNGHSFTPAEVEYLVRNNKFVIIDEAYIEYSNYESVYQLALKYDNCCVLRTFSKSLGFAGMRCGFVFANPIIIDKLQSIRMNYVSCSISTFLLRNFIDETSAHVRRMIDAKDFLIRLNFASISCGNYVCIQKQFLDTFSWCKYKIIDQDYFRVTLTDKSIFESNIDIEV